MLSDEAAMPESRFRITTGERGTGTEQFCTSAVRVIQVTFRAAVQCGSEHFRVHIFNKIESLHEDLWVCMRVCLQIF